MVEFLLFLIIGFMISIAIKPTKHDCQIKEILYPNTKSKPTKNFLSSNYRQIKLIQEQNRLKKQKQDTYVERNL